jgi:hypothetical protein
LKETLVVSKNFRQLNWRFCGFVLAFLSTQVSIVQCFFSSCYEYFSVPVSQALTSEVGCLSAQAFFLQCEYFCVHASQVVTYYTRKHKNVKNEFLIMIQNGVI